MQFQFRYGLIPVQAQLEEGLLTLRAFVKHQQVQVARLRYLYVDHKPGQSVVELLLCEARGAQLRRVRAYANPGEPGFEALIAALLEGRPEIDLRGRPRDEVYAMMGSRALSRGARVGLLAAAALGILGIFTPLVWHGLDRGHEEISVRALLDAKPRTRNLTLTGGSLLQDEAIVEADRAADEARVFFPLRPTPDGPIAVLVEVRGERRLAQIRAGAPLKGVLRDVAWEGVGPQQRRALEARELELGRPLYLFEFGARPSTDLTLTLMILLTLGLMGWVVRWALDPFGGRRPVSKRSTK